MDGFNKRYGFYPQYPAADAGYGSFNNYLFCEQHGMEKYMKFTMYKKEAKYKGLKRKANCVVRINEDLTQFHNEVLNNLNYVHGALLRMKRSIQAEGIFGGIKWNKGYKQLRRRGIEGVILELGLISCGFNLYKYYLMKMAMQQAA